MGGRGSESRIVEVIEDYREWSPRIPAKQVVERLLAETPKRLLSGLSRVTLTNSQALSHKERRRKVRSQGKKVRLATCLGLYSQRWQGRPASIELYVDNIEASVKPMPLIFCRLPVVSAFVFGTVLFHEIGHHIHATQRPEHREREDVADNWSTRLLHNHLHQRHRAVVYALWLVARVRKWWREVVARWSREPAR